MIQHNMSDYLVIKDKSMDITETMRYSARYGVLITRCNLNGNGAGIELTIWNKYTSVVISHCNIQGNSKDYKIPIIHLKTRLLSKIKRVKFTKKGSK